MPGAPISPILRFIRHRLAARATHGDVSFSGVEPLDVTTNRYDLNQVEVAVGGVVADRGRGAGFSDCAAQRRIAGDPPYLAAARFAAFKGSFDFAFRSLEASALCLRWLSAHCYTSLKRAFLLPSSDA